MSLLSGLIENFSEDVFSELFDSADWHFYEFHGSDIVWLLNILEPYEIDNLYNWYTNYQNISYNKFMNTIQFYKWLWNETNKTFIHSWYCGLGRQDRKNLKVQHAKFLRSPTNNFYSHCSHVQNVPFAVKL